MNWNTRELLRACLKSIEATPCSESVETIVVDNASADRSEEMVRSEFPEVILIPSGRNAGYAEGNNLGFRVARGRFILTLNPDTELHSTSLNVPISILDLDSTVGCVGIRQIGLNNETQSSVRGFPSLVGIAGDLLHVKSGRFDSYRLSRLDYTREQVVPQPMGTFLMFKRSALQAVGDPLAPFDLRFPIFFNEVDLLFRLSQAGFHCVYTPRASLLHHGGESTKQVRPQMIWESHRSLVRYFDKYSKSPLQRLQIFLLKPLIYLGALIRAKSFHAGFRP